MEFNEKLQALRRQKGWTQEELAARLYVSRTAVSKWESGRGHPNLDSLKALAALFSLSVDELLSSDEILKIAELDSRRKDARVRALVFGALDTSLSLLAFLPFFAARGTAAPEVHSLYTLSGVSPYLKVLYIVLCAGMTLLGIVSLARQADGSPSWTRVLSTLSLCGSAAAVLLFTVSLQPYAAAFTFALLLIKGLLLFKHP